MKKLICFFFVYLVLEEVNSASLPKEFVPCHKSDADFKNCLSKNMEAAIISLAKGNQNLKIKSLDPASVDAANIGKGTGPVDVAQNYTNIKIHGLSNVIDLQVKKVEIDNFLIEFEAHLPLLHWEADYKASGKILLLPIYGDGAANLKMINPRSVHRIRGELFTKKGKTYGKCKSYELTLFPEKIHMNFENMFNGNKLLGDNMNKIMNDNWKEIFVDVKSGYEEIIAAVLQNYCNQVFGRIPYDEIFLP